MGAPGANVYDPKDNYAKKNGPSYSVKKDKRDGDIGIFKNTPGAG